MTHFHLVQLKPLFKYRPHLTMPQTLVQLHEQTCSLWFFLAMMARHNSIRRLSQVEITKHVVYGLKKPDSWKTSKCSLTSVSISCLSQCSFWSSLDKAASSCS